MPTVGVAPQDEIPKPSAEGWWGQELWWSQSLGEGLIYSPMMAIHSAAEQTHGAEEHVAGPMLPCIAWQQHPGTHPAQLAGEVLHFPMSFL